MKTIQRPYLSIVIPVYNEEENVCPLYEKIRAVCDSMEVPYEVLFVDDGSEDNTFQVLSKLRETERNLAILKFQENAGQTAAMAAGFQYAEGERIISMDGDLQNDPADIPNLLEVLEDDCDIVCGWRKERHDKFWSRKVPSIIANWIIGIFTGVLIRDNGCSLKAYRSRVIKQVPLYGDMHRFIPAMSTVVTGRITEIVVKHHPRQSGKSKYGLGRIWRVFLDILAFKFILLIFSQISKFENTNDTQPAFDIYSNPKFNVYRLTFLISAPLFVMGVFLLKYGITATLSAVGLGIAVIGIGIITVQSLEIAKQKTSDLSPIASFLIHRCARRPLRYFGPLGTLLFILTLILGAVSASEFIVILMKLGMLMFCCGIFGEIITYANAKRFTEYKVETFLNTRSNGK